MLAPICPSYVGAFSHTWTYVDLFLVRGACFLEDLVSALKRSGSIYVYAPYSLLTDGRLSFTIAHITASGSTQLGDPSMDARPLSTGSSANSRDALESQWQDTTAEVRATVFELDAIQRERMQTLEERQAEVEGRLARHDGLLQAHAARLEKIETVFLSRS